MGGAPRLTIRRLLNHTSGLYEFNDIPRVLAPYLSGHLGHVWSPRRLVRLALTYDLMARPGSEHHYSNTNYLLAGLVVQAVTGHRLGDVLRQSVFAPAGLTSTTFTRSRTLPAPAAHGYFVFSGDQPTDITPLYPYPWASGAAVSTAPDVGQTSGLHHLRRYSSPDGQRQSVLTLNEDPSSLAQAVGPDFMRVLNQSFCG